MASKIQYVKGYTTKNTLLSLTISKEKHTFEKHNIKIRRKLLENCFVLVDENVRMQKSIVTGWGELRLDSPSDMGVGNEQLFQQFSESKIQP